MDPLMNAMSKRMRGRVQFRKDVEAEQRRMQLARERLERAVGALMDGRIEGTGHVGGGVRIQATVVLQARAMFAASKHAHLEVLAAATNQLAKRLAGKIEHGMLTGQFPEAEFEPLR